MTRAFAECSQNQSKPQRLGSRSVRLFSFQDHQLKTTLFKPNLVQIMIGYPCATVRLELSFVMCTIITYRDFELNRTSTVFRSWTFPLPIHGAQLAVIRYNMIFFYFNRVAQSVNDTGYTASSSNCYADDKYSED